MPTATHYSPVVFFRKITKTPPKGHTERLPTYEVIFVFLDSQTATNIRNEKRGWTYEVRRLLKVRTLVEQIT